MKSLRIKTRYSYGYKVGDILEIAEPGKDTFIVGCSALQSSKAVYARINAIHENDILNLDFLDSEKNTIYTGHSHSFNKNIFKLQKGNFMQSLNIIAKKVFDKDISALVRVGWLDSCLNVTETGKVALLAYLIQQNKTELGKMAQEEIDEQEKARK